MTGSQDLSEYTAEWQLVPSADGGTEVRYHVKLGLNAGVPRFLLNQAVKKSTADTMDALKKAVAAR